MQKKLNLKIKNTQLADALKLDKDKDDTDPNAALSSGLPKGTISRRVIKKADLRSRVKIVEQKEQVELNELEHMDVSIQDVEAPIEGQSPGDIPLAEPPSIEQTVVVPVGGDIPAVVADDGADDKKPKTKRRGQQRYFDKPGFGRGAYDSRTSMRAILSGADRTIRHRPKPRTKTPTQEAETIRPKSLIVNLPVTIKELSHMMKRKASELISKLLSQGFVFTINDLITDEITVELIGGEFECEISIAQNAKILQLDSKTIKQEIEESDQHDVTTRPPVVAFMGHVDHGKTSLIDAIRKSHMANSEAGAITQHIGAFACNHNGQTITVLDTPGHEAFALMRERGTLISDIMVLAIAGDAGIQNQTEEIISLARHIDIPVVVAITKCDKSGFDSEVVYRQLSDHQYIPEAWGGDTITVNCSAHSGSGISSLMDMIMIQAEVLELKCNSKMRARGRVIEVQVNKGFGIVTTVIIQNGTLNIDDSIVLEDIYARVKTMHNDQGTAIHHALPSLPVRITGFSKLPSVGDEFTVVESEKIAKKIADERSIKLKSERCSSYKDQEFEALVAHHHELKGKKVIPIILRTDVQGSLEAVKKALLELPSEKVKIVFVHEGVGEITESDVRLATALNGIIVGFHTVMESHIEGLIRQHKIRIVRQDVIYHIIDNIKDIMEDSLDKMREEHEQGAAEVRKLFKSSSFGIIAGCAVIDGTIKRSNLVRVFRKSELVFEGEISSIRKTSDDVKEVSKGMECGIVLKKFGDFAEGDIIRGFEVTYIKQDLS